ncbi:unnamed protein product [Symbiodinium natans]|uniref:Reverse transcriptase domain-containing protein n=1 Tax=Symbiodinium natans TaxID=878477 RepID=A0A812PV82_9DINO|nr:unnamed protein product [Symbiodinium natans]
MGREYTVCKGCGNWIYTDLITQVYKALEGVWEQIPEAARVELSKAGFRAPVEDKSSDEVALLDLLQAHIGDLPADVQTALHNRNKVPDVPPEEAAITATNELKGASTKLRSLGHRKIRLQAKIDESKAALKALYVEMQNLMQELKAAEENMETLAKTFRDKVLQAPVQEEDEDFNLSEVLGSIGLSLDEAQLQKVRDAQAQHKLQRRQKAAEQLLAHAGFPPGLGGSPPGIGGQAIAAQLEAIGVTLTPDQKNMVITGQWPGPSQTIDLKAAIEQGCPNMEIEDLELRREELEVQLERKRRKLATQSASPPTSVKEGGKEKGAKGQLSWSKDVEKASTRVPSASLSGTPESQAVLTTPSKPGTEAKDQSLAACEEELVELVDKMPIRQGSLEEWAANHALHQLATHRNEPSVCLEAIADAKRQPKDEPAKFEITVANVTKWRAEIKTWLLDRRPQGACLQETHLTAKEQHLAIHQLDQAGYAAWTLPAHPTEGGKNSGGVMIAVEKDRNFRFLRSFGVEGKGYVAVVGRTGKRDIVFISIYLETSVGLTGGHNPTIVGDLIAFIKGLTIEWFVAGDFNLPPQDILETSIESLLRGKVLATNEPTIMGGNEIDFAIASHTVSNGLEITTDWDVPFRPFRRPVDDEQAPFQGHFTLVYPSLLLEPRADDAITAGFAGFTQRVEASLYPSDIRGLRIGLSPKLQQVVQSHLSQLLLNWEECDAFRKAHQEQAKKYEAWLQGDGKNHLRHLYRALKTEENTTTRPFADLAVEVKPHARRAWWADMWAPSGLSGTHGTDPRLALQNQARKQAANLSPISVEEWNSLLKKVPNKAPGPDGWCYEMLRALPHEAILELASMVRQWEIEAQFPQHCDITQYAMLPKNETSERPIGLTHVLHRIFCKARWHLITEWENSYNPTSPWNQAKAGNSSLDTALRRLIRAETNKREKRHTITLLLDLTSFYETVPHWQLLAQGVRHSFPPLLLERALSLYSGSRYIEAQGSLSRPIRATRGLIAGCPLAPALSRVVLHDPISKMHSASPVHHIDLWVDDCSADFVDSHAPTVAAQAIKCYRELQADLENQGLMVSTTKTAFICSNKASARELQSLLEEHEPPIKTLGKDLGLDYAAGQRRRITVAKGRHAKGGQRARKLTKLQVKSTSIRVRLFNGSIRSSALYGHEGVGVAPKRRKWFRSLLAAALGRPTLASTDSALEFHSNKVVDPAYTILSQHFKAIRRLLLSWPDRDIGRLHQSWNKLGQWLSEAEHPWKRAAGPLGAAWCYLQELGWEAISLSKWRVEGDILDIRQGPDFHRLLFQLKHLIDTRRHRRIAQSDGGKGLETGPDWTALSRRLQQPRVPCATFLPPRSMYSGNANGGKSMVNNRLDGGKITRSINPLIVCGILGSCPTFPGKCPPEIPFWKSKESYAILTKSLKALSRPLTPVGLKPSNKRPFSFQKGPTSPVIAKGPLRVPGQEWRRNINAEVDALVSRHAKALYSTERAERLQKQDKLATDVASFLGRRLLSLLEGGLDSPTVNPADGIPGSKGEIPFKRPSKKETDAEAPAAESPSQSSNSTELRRASPDQPRHQPEPSPTPPAEGGEASTDPMPVKQESTEEFSSEESSGEAAPLPPWPLLADSLHLTVDRVRRSNNRDFWLSNLGPTLWLDCFPTFKGSSLLGIGGTRAVYTSPTSEGKVWKVALKADPSHHGIEQTIGQRLPGLCATQTRMVGTGQLTIRDFKTLEIEVLEVERLTLLPDQPSNLQVLHMFMVLTALVGAGIWVAAWARGVVRTDHSSPRRLAIAFRQRLLATDGGKEVLGTLIRQGVIIPSPSLNLCLPMTVNGVNSSGDWCFASIEDLEA